MVNYIRTIDHATSVKKISILKEPGNDLPGLADFKANPVFSVFDYGTIQPAIPLDNSTITLMAAYNFELLREKGIESHYQGLVCPNGEVISAKEAIRRKTAPDTIRVQFVNRLLPEFDDEKGVWDYSAFHNGEVQCYVHPLELISRNGLPEASSVWKRVKKGDISMSDLGLPEEFQPGDTVPEELIPILDYSTKFEPDDRYLSPEEARQIAGLSPERFDGLNDTTRKASMIMTEYADSRGFSRADGKVEQITYFEDGKPVDVLGDAVCTWHEDRLTIHGIGISKQRIRNKVKALNQEWYEDIQRAKEEAKSKGLPSFKNLLDKSIKYNSPSAEFFEAVNNLFRAGTNQWIGEKVYDVHAGDSIEDALERAVEDFNKIA